MSDTPGLQGHSRRRREGGEGEIKPHKGSKRKNKTPLQDASSGETETILWSRLKEGMHLGSTVVEQRGI